jgi:isoquinoline 1-oxidoreductase beta subunit
VGTVDGVFLTATKKFNFQITGGSASVRFTGTHAMRIAGAAARAMLLRAAAVRWGVPLDELTIEKGHISHKASLRTGSFADFAEEAAKQSAPVKPTLKSIAEFTIMGTSPARYDIPAKVDGTAIFGLDVSLPGMKYATIKASPVFGQKVMSINESAIQDMAGIHKVVNLGSAVAVIANGYWIAKKALERLEIKFEKSENQAISQEDIFRQYIRDLDRAEADGEEEVDFKSGDAKAAHLQASHQVEATYRIPYLAHATMEPMNCTAWVQDDGCQIWVGSQNPLGFANEVAEVLKLDLAQVQVHNQYLGGGFGRRAEPDIARQAALVAKEVSFPVKLIWSREEDIQQDFYREANISRFKAGLDSHGKPVAWINQFLFKHHPPEAPLIPYEIEHQLIHYTDSKTHVPWGNWRSVDHSMHGFFTESFMDELAHAAEKDPYEYRRSLLEHAPRYLKVLDLAAEKSGWGKSLPAGWGRGIALHQSFGTIVAEVVEVEIREGKLKTQRVVCVADPGFAVHPDGFKAQMESGIIYGLTAALYGEVTIENGAVAQSNFHDYQMVRMREAPAIETYIVNSGHSMGGAGEPSTPAIGPALANAIFAATGKRIRELPIKNQDLTVVSKHLG